MRFSEFILQEEAPATSAASTPTGMPPGGLPGMPGGPPPGGLPSGGGMPPIGGGGMGGMGMPPMGGGGMGGMQAPPTTFLKTSSVWDVLEKVLDKHKNQ